MNLDVVKNLIKSILLISISLFTHLPFISEQADLKSKSNPLITASFFHRIDMGQTGNRKANTRITSAYE